MDWAGGRRGEAMRAFRHTTPCRKAHQPTPHQHKTPPTAHSLRSVSRSPYLHPHTWAQKKTAPLPMLSYSLKYSIKLECYCCTCCYYSRSKFLSPVTTQSPSVTPQSPLRRESAAGCHADQPAPTTRAFRHTPMPRKAHQLTPHLHKTQLIALSLRSVSRSPYLHPHTRAQKKTAPLLMLHKESPKRIAPGFHL